MLGGRWLFCCDGQSREKQLLVKADPHNVAIGAFRSQGSQRSIAIQTWSLFSMPHLSKGLSGRKQKCTQFPTPFSGTIFHALLHGVIYFVRSVSFINLEMEVSDLMCMTNCAQKWRQKMCAFLFQVTWAFGNMWDTFIWRLKIRLVSAFYRYLPSSTSFCYTQATILLQQNFRLFELSEVKPLMVHKFCFI